MGGNQNGGEKSWFRSEVIHLIFNIAPPAPPQQKKVTAYCNFIAKNLCRKIKSVKHFDSVFVVLVSHVNLHCGEHDPSPVVKTLKTRSSQMQPPHHLSGLSPGDGLV